MSANKTQPDFVAILTPDFRPGDAVGEDTLGLLGLLGSAGIRAQVFAPTGERSLSFGHPRQLAAALRSAQRPILIYQFAVAYDAGLQLFAQAECARVVRYHNVTPSAFYQPYNAAVALACERGRQQLEEFIGLAPDLYLPASQFNARELFDLGVESKQAYVLPPLVNLRSLIGSPVSFDLLSGLAMDLPRPPTLLSVGRVVPNKGHRQLIEAFARFRRMEPTARLIIAGSLPADMSSYHEELFVLVGSLGLGDCVKFTGRISLPELKACYASADIYACFSEHEGFCVPLMEASALGVPVTALARAAVPETLGPDSLLLETTDPQSWCELWQSVLSEHPNATRDLALQQSALGLRRVDHFFASQAPEPLLQRLNSLSVGRP